ncbi:MAG TPA: hypothetical protein VG273_15080 [Bryobacteraceae bacterium]|jgi:hypothetical protein|nr:hypothetical protein [Bryobacteraceae bacterium]
MQLLSTPIFLSALAIICAFTGSAQDRPDAPLPTDAGVYAKSPTGQWDEIEPEIVNWKTGGVAKSAFSYGIVKGDINGHVKGGKSKTKLGSNEILVVALEGVSITEYQLLRMREHSESREFRAATGGVLHQSGGSDRDVLDFDHKKVANRTFLVTLPAAAKDGEYGLLPPGAVVSKSATSLGKVYSFRITN